MVAPPLPVPAVVMYTAYWWPGTIGAPSGRRTETA